MSLLALPHCVARFLHPHDDGAAVAARRVERTAATLLDEFRCTGAQLGHALDRQRRRTRVAPTPALPRPQDRRGPIGLVIEAGPGYGIRLAQAHAHARHPRAPLVSVGLIDGAMAPPQLHDLLKLIRETKRRGEEVLVRAPFDSWLEETLAVAGRVLDEAAAGRLAFDHEDTLLPACAALAPHARFSDRDLGSLCAFHFYCRCLFPASETQASPGSTRRWVAAEDAVPQA
ncbi:hypothetical protein [Mitsuaria sp. GD03876]|uniref:hypothetical protein n=1 Tax=Mitsuaria sp. GD03876 TaxID=2975399 RepID=UPI00244AB4EC|nr:hypothetical protein [Mitsuaria sp. GD03876]MDH0865744.1 hypothetical protein [Mitsuaria sp. GD03876]